MMSSSTPRPMLFKAFALLLIVGIVLFVGCWALIWILYYLTNQGGPIFGESMIQMQLASLSNIGLILIAIGILGLLAFRVYIWTKSE